MSMAMPASQVDESANMIPLTLLRAGQGGRIGAILGAGGVVSRLREMGLRAGATVEIIRSGSSCILRLDGQKICVRSDEMTGVLVRIGIGS